MNEFDTASPAWKERGHRAIGVVYRPQFEQYGNYVPTILPGRYGALLDLEQTAVVHPLDRHVAADHDLPDTYPTGV